MQWFTPPASPKAGYGKFPTSFSNTNYKVFLQITDGGAFKDKTATNSKPYTKDSYYYDWRVGTGDDGSSGVGFAIGY